MNDTPSNFLLYTELQENATARKIRVVQADRKTKEKNCAKRQIVTRMADWIKFLHSFLELSNYPILTDKGKVSMLEAKLKAEAEFEKYRVIQDKNYISDFDREIKRIMGKKNADK